MAYLAVDKMGTNLKLEKLKSKLSDLESKLYQEQCKQHEKINRMGWGARNEECEIHYFHNKRR